MGGADTTPATDVTARMKERITKSDFSHDPQEEVIDRQMHLTVAAAIDQCEIRPPHAEIMHRMPLA